VARYRLAMPRRVRTQTGKTNRSQVDAPQLPKSRLAQAGRLRLQKNFSPDAERKRPTKSVKQSRQRTGVPHRRNPTPSIHNEKEAIKFVESSLAKARRFQREATKRRVFATVSEYMRGRGKGSLNTLYQAFQQHQTSEAGEPSFENGISRKEFKDFLNKTPLASRITDDEMDLAFDLADRDGSGAIDHQEFLDVFAPEQVQRPPVERFGLSNAERLQVKKELDSLRLKVLNKLGAAGKTNGEAGGVGRALWKAYKIMDENGDG